MWSPWNLLFSRLNHPTFLSLCQRGAPSLWPPLWCSIRSVFLALRTPDLDTIFQVRSNHCFYLEPWTCLFLFFLFPFSVLLGVELGEVGNEGGACIWPLAKANSLQSSDSSPFYTTCSLAEGRQCHVVQVFNEEVEHYWPQYRPLGYTVTSCLPTGFCATGSNPVGFAIQPKRQLLHCAFA